ncbi:MAG: IS1595 family transposase [Sphingomonas sp.]
MDIAAPRFIDEDTAREHLEALRWPEGPFCPHCGSLSATRLPAQRGRPSKRNPEGALRKGVIQCNDCRKQYTVTVGTLFEDSKVPLNKWLLANHLLCSSKKGMSAHQLHRMIGVTYKTAWFMFHRLREAMAATDDTPFGSGGGMVEVDETYVGRDPERPHKPKARVGGRTTAPNFRNKIAVVSLIDRETGRSSSVVVQNVTIAELQPIIAAKVHPSAILMTDQAHFYRKIGAFFASHETVNHGRDEYVRKGAPTIHTNTIEGFFGVFKRGLRGTYQHMGKQHLHRYLSEFDFRYSTRSALDIDDAARADIALKGIAGRRLFYRRPSFAA